MGSNKVKLSATLLTVDHTFRHVLTAAHCTQDLEFPHQLNVLLGEHDLTTSFDQAVRYTVSRIIEHPGYNPETISNDYTILVLSEQVIIYSPVPIRRHRFMPHDNNSILAKMNG